MPKPLLDHLRILTVLRHTTATVLLEAGAHPKLVQDLLGHSTVALTVNTYSHVTPGLSREAARTMDTVLGAISRSSDPC
jgi:site-specific recombinase XerD